MDKDERFQFFSRLSIILFGIASAALVITIYHCINVSNWCNHRGIRRRRQRLPQTFRSEQVGTPSSVENSMLQLIIPAHKYEKGVGLAGGEVDGTCAVCLSEFEEGEDVRTLPECLHSFHVPCIDMWLYSHSNCPMCRTQATPSPQILIHQFQEYASGGPPETQLESSMLPAIIVQSRILY